MRSSTGIAERLGEYLSREIMARKNSGNWQGNSRQQIGKLFASPVASCTGGAPELSLEQAVWARVLRLSVEPVAPNARIKRLLDAASRALLAFDAWLDSSTFAGREKAIGILWTIDEASDRIHLFGAPRVPVELACEALTLGLTGL
jgi:hypothetical protein